MGGRPISEKERSEIIVRYTGGESTRIIGTSMGRGNETVRQVLIDGNVTRKSTGNPYGYRKYTIDHDFFKNIDTSSKAYWLGFIAADGHVIENEGLTIGLMASDIGHLEKIKLAIQSNSPIKSIEVTKAVRINIYSKTMAMALTSHGFFHNKSNTLLFPAISEIFYKEFLRGLLDGDGCISGIKKDLRVAFSGTRSIIENVRKIMIDKAYASCTKIQEGANGFCVIQWGGRRQSLRIMDWLYDGADDFLDRKYNKYIKERDFALRDMVNDFRVKNMDISDIDLQYAYYIKKPIIL